MARSTGRARTNQPMLALVAGSVLTLAALLASRPQLSGGPTSWPGDQLALACVWWAAVVSSAWLGVTTLACITALARGNTRAAHRLAAWAPPLARRALRAALISTWALVPSAAYGAPPAAPITVHVGAGGRLTTGSERAVTEVPVVRTPGTTPSSAPTSTSTSTSTTIPRSAVVPLPSRPPAAATPTGSIPAGGRDYVVQSGDNLWRIARAEVIRTSGEARPHDARIAPYWRRLISANHATLRSGDPSLIFPGEIVTRPTR